MNQKPELLVDFCDYKAAKYAVTHWHYSRTMPAGKLVKFGVWESSKFIGCVLFGRGANNNIGKPFDLSQTAVCELVRVALSKHVAPVSQIVMRCIRRLRVQNLRLIVSYADPQQNHVGSIYQAMNWIYVGGSRGDVAIRNIATGETIHKRTSFSNWGSVNNIPFEWEYYQPPHRYKYLYPLDKAMRRQIEPLAKPYPKRAGVGKIDTPTGVQPVDAGAIPAVRS